MCHLDGNTHELSPVQCRAPAAVPAVSNIPSLGASLGDRALPFLTLKLPVAHYKRAEA